MTSRLTAFSLLFLSLTGYAQTPKPPLTTAQYQADFDFFWETVRTDYAYFDHKQTDWNLVRTRYRPQLDTLRRRAAFVRLLEQALGELYDHHAGLGTNRPDSRRLVPSGSDLYAEWVDGQARVLDLRRGFGAERVGLRPGMTVLAVNGLPVEQAMQPLLPRCQRQPDPAARNFALNQLLAGDHRTPRQLTVAQGRKTLTLRPDEPTSQLENIRYAGRVSTARLGQVGYVKVNNCLFDNQLIAAFDSAVDQLSDTRGLILDLRETPSGGNTAVARAIMGRFITQELPYQLHELPSEQAETGIRRRWLELVSPHGRTYSAPLVVLVGRWTGSMGEGLALGFDALHRATVVGTELARLNGAIYSYRLPASGIGFNIPVERLSHVNGQPREQYRPPVLVDPASAKTPADDPWLQAGLAALGAGPK